MKRGIRVFFFVNTKFLLNTLIEQKTAVCEKILLAKQNGCFEGQLSLKYVINLRIYYFCGYWEVNTR